jgi:hypothetical protein
MAASRFAGGPVVERLGTRNVIAGGGVLISLGMLLVLAAPWQQLSVLGFLVIGVGAANISPLLMSQGSRVPGVAPSIGVAAIASGLTSGILLGPPIIGFVAQALTLPVALALVGTFGAIIAASAMTRTWYAVGA